MHPARFVTVCCLYSGAVFLLTQILLYPSQLNVPAIWNSGAAVCILFAGLYRLYSEGAEKYPSEYGLLTTGIAFLSLMVTVICLAVLTEFWK